MPVMNGMDATRIIKSHYPNLPVVAQSAQAFEEDKAAILESGCVKHLSKPLKREDLLSTLVEFLVA